ncbi:StAR-related lipid transfer protein 13 [Amphibalanus amphitrite]|uniref:StAR-related lipid transfer protein 13 n=1 Tax=Amphibalanus amphitrite TaxID=1232801 RepID=A0A6A4WUD5_AMPAM|nr:StAR-related lipid transfer protein 13 [Amphibalanus amphitrite]
MGLWCGPTRWSPANGDVELCLPGLGVPVRRLDAPPSLLAALECRCPIDLRSVQSDHPSLDLDSRHALFKRINTVNRATNMKLEGVVRRVSITDLWVRRVTTMSRAPSVRTGRTCATRSAGGVTRRCRRRRPPPALPCASSNSTLNSDSSVGGTVPERRSGRERLQDGILRRMESLRARRKRAQKAPRDDSSSYFSASDASGSPRTARPARDDSGALSDGEHSPPLFRALATPGKPAKDANSKLKRKESMERPLPPQCPPPQTPDRHRVSTYDNTPIVVYNRVYVDDDAPGTPPSPGVRDARANSSPQIQTVEAARPLGTNVVRWHSFHRSGSGLLTTRPAPAPICPTHISRLSSGQIALLKKHALLRITATMERHCPSKSSNWNWDIPKFMRKFRVPDYRDRRVFGVPLTVTARRSGHPLPPTIVAAMDYLRKNALDQVGLFRKSGVRSRIQKVREMCEAADGDEPLPFDDHQAYDVADMIKQYFRELPEVLLTHKISEILIAIYQYVPSGLRLEATKCALLLMPDESRLALQTLLAFLSDVAAASYVNQMTAHNLSVCLAPSVFSVTSQRSASASPRRTRRAGVPDQRELNENRAAHECLAALIRQSEALFCLPEDLLSGCRFSYLDVSQPVALPALGTEEQPGSWRAYTDACCAALLREARDRPRGWVTVAADDPGLDLAYRKVGDGHQLRLWRAGVELEAPPAEVLHRLLRQRHAYDLRLVKWRVVERLAADAEVFQYAVSAVEPLPVTEYCVLRAWRSDLPRGACAVVETSVEHPDSLVQPGGRRGVVLASRYLIEPCGAGKSRVTHFSRADHRGCSPEWYNKVYGHLCGLQLTSLRESFRHVAEGPESQV